MQRTLNINGDKIKMTARAITSVGNLMGFRVVVNGYPYRFHVLTADEAFEKAYVKFIKEHR